MTTQWTKEPTREGHYLIYGSPHGDYAVVKVLKIGREFYWNYSAKLLSQLVNLQPIHLLSEVYWYGPIPSPSEDL